MSKESLVLDGIRVASFNVEEFRREPKVSLDQLAKELAFYQPVLAAIDQEKVSKKIFSATRSSTPLSLETDEEACVAVGLLSLSSKFVEDLTFPLEEAKARRSFETTWIPKFLEQKEWGSQSGVAGVKGHGLFQFGSMPAAELKKLSLYRKFLGLDQPPKPREEPRSSLILDPFGTSAPRAGGLILPDSLRVEQEARQQKPRVSKQDQMLAKARDADYDLQSNITGLCEALHKVVQSEQDLLILPHFIHLQETPARPGPDYLVFKN